MLEFFELRINNEICSFEPQTCGEVLYESFRRGRCSKLSFNIVGKEYPPFTVREGDKVSFKAAGKNLFLGVVFQRKKVKDGIVSVVAYDQLRYLKNRDTYVYSYKRASDIVRMIALDYRLRLGEVQDTYCVIPYRIEDNVTLIDIIENALDFEIEHSGQSFILVDEFGSLSLKKEEQMLCDTVLNKYNTGGCGFVSSIENRSNRVKVSRYDRSSGLREIFIANDTDSESKLGVLQHYQKISDKNEHLASRAYSLLARHNKDERSITVKNANGDVNVRGGSRVLLDLDDYKGYASVLSCSHRFSEGGHLMDLVLGG